MEAEKKEKVALITGGTGGIGTAIARCLADRGIKVATCYNRAEPEKHKRARTWQRMQKEEGYYFLLVCADVGDYEACSEMVREVSATLGPVDILVNGAGITRDAPFRKMSVEQWREVLHVNLDSVFNVTHAVLPGMLERGFGRVVTISSVNGEKGQFGQTNYAASKAGIYGFTRSLAQEVARKGVTVNAISPGYVDTNMVRAVPPDVLEKIIAQIPMGRLAKPQEIAELIAFLSSEGAAYITGANISINGGLHMS